MFSQSFVLTAAPPIGRVCAQPACKVLAPLRQAGNDTILQMITLAAGAQARPV